MLKKKKQRLKTIEKKLANIEAEYPSINFKDLALNKAINAHYALVKEMIGLKVDIKFCPTENRNEMCQDCNCWKAVANRCM
jgi:hypothetical protein